MLFDIVKQEFEINGTKCSFETGRLARKADSSVLGRMGGTVVLVTVMVGKEPSEANFFPLTVEYMEKMYAAGLISSSRFVKRDRFPSDDAILRARIIDRSIRSRFPSDFRNEVQIIVKVLSYDPDYDPVLVAVNTVSAALMISPAPFDGPISAVRVGLAEDGDVHSLYHQLDRDNGTEFGNMNLVIAGDGELFNNIDANMYEVSEDQTITAMQKGLEMMRPWIEAQKEFAGKKDVQKLDYEKYEIPSELIEDMKIEFGEQIRASVNDVRFAREGDKLREEVYSRFEGSYTKNQIYDAYEYIAKKMVRKEVLDTKIRIDGRGLDDIRELDVEVGTLPRVHGSALFTRGGTQVLTVATLGTTRSQQTVEDMTGENTRRYMHFYVESPFSHGETGRVRYIPGRREVGHGALAEKALFAVLPSLEEFPYTMLLMSEIMSEEGSSSMASVCGSTLALMDAGVPLKKPVAGIAIGLMMDESNPENFVTLVDMQGKEDFFGFMDFKVAGTRDGITAIQMDTKARGLSIEVFKDAIAKAKTARMKILDRMNSIISTPRSAVSQYAPKVVTEKIPVEKIGELIGPGGKNIKKLTEETGAEFDITEDGTVNIFASTEEEMEKARKIIKGYSFKPEVGAIYEGKVSGITDFGAFVDLAPGVSGLVHISELKDGFVKNVGDVVHEGDVIKVKVLGVDDSGKIKLSMKQV